MWAATVVLGMLRLSSVVRHRVRPGLGRASRAGVDATGWWVGHVADALLRAGRVAPRAMAGYVGWWSRAAPAAGRRLVDATGWVLTRGTEVVRRASGRLVHSFTGFMTVTAAAVTWVVVVAAALVPAAEGYGEVVDVEFAVPEDTTLPRLAQRSVVYAADGSELAVLHDEQDRREVPFDSVPDHVWQAVLAAEDRRFFSHDGYDVEAISRAAVANVQARGVAQGGSTITQQLAKMNFLSAERTLERKAEELAYALAMEERFSKEELLERYLNQVYFGGGAYGVAAAAEEWFDAPPERLSLEQAATLAAMIRAPGRLDPRNNPDAVEARRDAVLRGMGEEGYISRERAEFAVDVPLLVMPRRERPVVEPFVVEAVKRDFFENPAFGETRPERIDRLFTGGLRIHTTIDPRVQDAAHAVVEAHYPNAASERTAAIAAVDPRTGRIVATHSGVDFEAEAYDLATQGRRQPGSAFKTLVLATALERGRSIHSTISGGGPRAFAWDPHQEPYVVRNFANSSYGTLTLHEALVRSVNTAFVELMLTTGISFVVEKAGEFGIDTDEAFGSLPNQGPAMAIGGMFRGVTPLEMASAIGVFATGGERAAPYVIERVDDANGNEVYRHAAERTRVVSPQTAGSMIDAMRAVVNRGTGTRARLPGWDVGGKTGTSQIFADAWFIGTTPVLSTAVWVGHPDGRVPYPGMTGGQFAAPVWRDFMQSALEGRPPEPFPVPPPPPAPPPPAPPPPAP
ncbi:MAG: transglycosylase domain-containing protein [Egibacteraceae bacterium]